MKFADKIVRRLAHSRLLIGILAILVFLLETKSSTIFLREYESSFRNFENTVYLSACENNTCQQAYVEEDSIRLIQLLESTVRGSGMQRSVRVFQLLLLLQLFGQTLVFALLLYQLCFLFGDPPSLIQLILRICDARDGKKRLSFVHVY